MNMFSSLMGGLVDKEKITHDTIQGTLEDLAEELGCSHNELFVMIKPTDSEFNMKFYVYHSPENAVPKFVREISLKEILGE
jgi:hypothetical protein